MKRQPPTKKATTTKGDSTPLFHPDDWEMLQRFREELMGRHTFLNKLYGETGMTLGPRVGRGGSFISDMENGDMRIMLSHVQLWCRIFEFRLGLEMWSNDPDGGFPVPHTGDLSDPNVQMMLSLKDSDKGQRLLLLTRLKAIRELKKIGVNEVARHLSLSREAVRRWEEGARDPLLPALFQRVRALGLVLKFTVIR